MATCKDCIHFEVCDSGRHIGEYEIDDGVYSDGVENECLTFKNKADYAEVKHGEWKASVMGTGAPHCSVCNGVAPSRYIYCPHCGAKMDGERKGAE